MGKLPKINLTWRVSFWINPDNDGKADSLPESLLLAIRRSRDYLFEHHICVYASHWSLTIDEENYAHFRLDILSRDDKALTSTDGRIETNTFPLCINVLPTTIGQIL
jgi:hypothetical protein